MINVVAGCDLLGVQCGGGRGMGNMVGCAMAAGAINMRAACNTWAGGGMGRRDST